MEIKDTTSRTNNTEISLVGNKGGGEEYFLELSTLINGGG